MKITLVVPCYNEVERIQAKEFISSSDIHYLFVNDGSSDDTLKLLTQIKGPQISIINLVQNVGKAEAVRLGMLEALKANPDAQWIGYWDADLATPLTQLNYMLNFLKINEGDYSAVFGSRIMRLGSNIKRNFLRHLLGRLFVTYASIMLKCQAYDSQCGAKIFKSEIVKDLFVEKFISKWFFDLEIIQRLRLLKHDALECPLQVWHDVEGSKISPIKDGLKAFIEIIRIRKKYAFSKTT